LTRTRLIRPLVIVAVGFLAYANSFHSPFAFDDATSIGRNPDVTGIGTAWPPLSMRWFATLSFALNYRLGGLDPFGYHVVNLAIHLASALLVCRLITLTLRTPVFSATPAGDAPGAGDGVAFVAALLFVSHPIQTQAVTYVAQRYASLATMLYLLCLALFLQWRLARAFPARDVRGPAGGAAAGASARGHLAYAGALGAAVLAMLTKEIAFTLPLALALAEALLFRGRPAARALRVLPFLATLAIVPLNIALVGNAAGSAFTLDRATRFLSSLPRSVYLQTQFRVVVTYIRLLFFPAGQNLDYDYPVYRSFLAPAVWASFVFLLAVALAGAWFAAKAVRGFPRLAPAEAGCRQRSFGLIALGIFWFFGTLSVESSVIPLQEIIAENRLYLPSVGAFTAGAAALLLVARRLAAAAGGGTVGRALPAVLVVLVVASLAAATHRRNRVWQSTLSLCEDMVRKSPSSSRAHVNLGLAYHEQGWLDQAIAEYETSLRLNPYYEIPHCNLAAAFRAKGRYDQALDHERFCRFGQRSAAGAQGAGGAPR
jgi:tetratricopeptide (TPR) repeat protein